MALVTFTTGAILAADLNNNFQDEEANDLSARTGYLPGQSFRLAISDLDTAADHEKELVFTPVVPLRVFDLRVHLSHTANVPSVGVGFECLTTARALGNQVLTETVTPTATTDYTEQAVLFDDNNVKILLPGFEYRLYTPSTGECKHVEFVLSCFAIRGRS